MEQGHYQQGAALGQLVGVALGQGLARPQEVARSSDAAGQHVGGHVAVGAQGALGPARGPRGVEDGGVVVGGDIDIRKGKVRQVFPAVDRPDHRLQPPHPARRLHALGQAGDIDALQVGQARQVGHDALEPLVVDDDDPGPGVGEAVLQLRPGPPAVQGGHNGAGEDPGIKGHRPFREVAQDHRHPVALAHTVSLQLAGQGDGGAGEGLVGRPVVLVDQEFPGPEGPGVQEDVAQGRRRILPDPLHDATDLHLLHLVALARRRQARMRLVDRQYGPFGSGV